MALADETRSDSSALPSLQFCLFLRGLNLCPGGGAPRLQRLFIHHHEYVAVCGESQRRENKTFAQPQEGNLLARRRIPQSDDSRGAARSQPLPVGRQGEGKVRQPLSPQRHPFFLGVEVSQLHVVGKVSRRGGFPVGQYHRAADRSFGPL